MYKGRGSTNEKMMRGIPGRGKVPEKVEREAQLIFMRLQKKLNKGGKKDEEEKGSLGEKAARPGEPEERRGEQRGAEIRFNDFILTLSSRGEAENDEGKLPSESTGAAMTGITPRFCFPYRTAGGGKDGEGKEELHRQKTKTKMQSMKSLTRGMTRKGYEKVGRIYCWKRRH